MLAKLSNNAYSALWVGVVVSLLFTGIIWLAGGWLKDVYLLPDQGPTWYVWKLPNPTIWTRTTAWGLYLLHQVAIWGTIYYAQTRVKRYSAGLHGVNIAALGINALFIVLHFIQTHIWYDGLAQDVSIFSSQGSVIVLLVWVLLMENQRRGMFFGQRLPIAKSITQAARKYHGYVFAWAIVYTFWYHPMESTSGHLIGFIYMFLLMLQGSLMFTRAHVNRWWTLVQEAMVLVHGTLVAWMQSGPDGLWPMFFFGFLGLFIITQMHGLGLSRKVRWALFLAYVGLVTIIYSWRGMGYVDEVIRIPVIEYLSVVVLALLIGLFVWLGRWLGPLLRRPPATLPSHGD